MQHILIIVANFGKNKQFAILVKILTVQLFLFYIHADVDITLTRMHSSRMRSGRS